jgi:SHS family lactate transporter-like MFS transporter
MPRYDYGRVICIFMACTYVYVICLTFLGPEKLGRSFRVENDD